MKARNVKDIKIAYIGGGSRAWAWNLMGDLSLEPELGGTVRLYDIDLQAAKDNEVIGNRVSAKPGVKGVWKYQAVETLPKALKGADFIIISILPGTFEEMRSDVHLPEEYGIYQPVGDTVGPGGIIRALRTVPMYVEIAEAIKKHAPESWVINYTNPMAVCTRTLYEVFPGIKAFGCCHEVFSTQKLLTFMLKDMRGIMDVGRDEIETNVLGINHFTWFDSAKYHGIDLFPMYREFSSKYYESGFSETDDPAALKSVFHSFNRVKFDLFRRYGLIAAAGDRHLVEFCPPWYLKNPRTVAEWKFKLTKVDWRVEDLKRRLERSAKLRKGTDSINLEKGSGEEGVLLMKAILGLKKIVTNVNLPNRGQIPSLPLDAIVETNAVFSANSVIPVLAGSLPPEVNALVYRQIVNQEAILKAALNRDRDLAFKAFANDPLVAIDIVKARELFERMLANTKKFLPGWF